MGDGNVYRWMYFFNDTNDVTNSRASGGKRLYLHQHPHSLKLNRSMIMQ